MKKLFKFTIYVFAIIGFLFITIYIALQTGLTKTEGIIDKQHDYFRNQKNDTSWQESEEWSILRQAILKDKETIDRVSRETGIPSRIIISPLVVEQLRLFNSEREIFKQVFSPLKILGNQSQFSWGVMGIKQDTAQEIEKRNPELGEPAGQVRFERLTNEKDRYYSYLYGAFMIKSLEQEWREAGFPIENNIGVIATLYNIGFQNSHPKPNPQIGGAEIEINKTTYSFGGLAESFYYSNELLGEFPR